MSFSEHSCMGGGGIIRVPVITIDGPTASGKGTVAREVAYRLGFHFLDSGMLYRITALLALRKSLSPTGESALVQAVEKMQCRFSGGNVLLSGEDVTEAIRQEEVGLMASQVASIPAVRSALFDRQLRFRQPPGLVADGRDMGTVVFPDADMKVFLTASAEARAERRYKQLIEKGISANIASLRDDLLERDRRDMERAVAPLVSAEDAFHLDTSDIDAKEAIERVMKWYRERCL